MPMTTIEDGFESFFRADYARVVSSVRLMVRSTQVAEGVAQDAFFRARKSVYRVRRHETRAWVEKTALHMATVVQVDHWGSEGLAAAWEAATVAEPVDVELLGAIDDLAPDERMAVVLVHLLGLSVSDADDVWFDRFFHSSIRCGRKRLKSALGESVSTTGLDERFDALQRSRPATAEVDTEAALARVMARELRPLRERRRRALAAAAIAVVIVLGVGLMVMRAWGAGR